MLPGCGDAPCRGSGDAKARGGCLSRWSFGHLAKGVSNRSDACHGRAIAARIGFSDGFAGRAYCSHCLWTADFEPHSRLGPGEAEQNLDGWNCGADRCCSDLCIPSLKEATQWLDWVTRSQPLVVCLTPGKLCGCDFDSQLSFERNYCIGKLTW